MSTVIAVDLDRTLVYSPAALGLTMPDALAPQLVVAELFEGRPLSFMTERAAIELRALAETTTLVPTTTRTRAQFERIRLPGVTPHYAVTTNGGKLLVDGVPDSEWAAVVRQELALSAPLEEIQQYLAAKADGPWVDKRRTAEHMFTYLVVVREEIPEGFVEEFRSWSAERNWAVSQQGRKIYCVPNGMTKSAALKEIVRRTGSSGYLAAGDSLLDAELLENATAGVRPAHGELAEQDWRRPHVEVTESTGVLAGEEIVIRLSNMAAVMRLGAPEA